MFFADRDQVSLPSRRVQDIGESPSAITVITREDIETSGASTLPDLLRMVPGMEVVTTSPYGLSLNSRGFWTEEGFYYLVLLDGREVNNSTDGHAVWAALPVSLHDVQRVEIIRGPGSSLYGANALAGVIQITTRPIPDRARADVHATLGELGFSTLEATAAFRVGPLGLSLDGGVNLAGHFDDPTTRGKRGWKLRPVLELPLDSWLKLRLEGDFSGTEGTYSMGGPGGVEQELGFRTVRLSAETSSVKAQLYWTLTRYDRVAMLTPLLYAGFDLGRMHPFEIDIYTLHGSVQWSLPELVPWWLTIVGLDARGNWYDSPSLVDGETYADPDSPRYLETGLSFTNWWLGPYLHTELRPLSWLTLTGSLRFDYSSTSENALSPQLATVFRLNKDHTLRLGVSQAFRKPTFLERHGHLAIDLSPGAPFTQAQRTQLHESAARLFGNPGVRNEKLTSLELGYRGGFFDSRLELCLDLFYNCFTDLIKVVGRFPSLAPGIPDIAGIENHFWNSEDPAEILGSELSLRYNWGANVMVMLSWTWRTLDENRDVPVLAMPAHLLTLGGEFKLDSGLRGSLFVFSRAAFWNRGVEDSQGILSGSDTVYTEENLLVLGRLGWLFHLSDRAALEVGGKIYLPVAPFSDPAFRYRDLGGGFRQGGESYGGEALSRMISAYLEGRF